MLTFDFIMREFQRKIKEKIVLKNEFSKLKPGVWGWLFKGAYDSTIENTKSCLSYTRISSAVFTADLANIRVGLLE